MLSGLLKLITSQQQRASLRNMLVRSLGVPHAGRHLTVRNTDLFIVSYPRSGNTWTRFLVANLLHPERTINFKNIGDLIPDIYRTSSLTLRRKESPRIIKSHEYFDPRYRRVIYVVRDPRDVLLSLYNFRIKTRKLPEGYPIHDFADEFLETQITPYGTWGQNVGSWIGARQDDDFLLIRYEDLQQKTPDTVRTLGSFLGKDLPDERVEEVIEASSYDRMRDLEKQQSSEWSATKNSRSDYRFVNEGRSGYWSEKLPDEQADKIYRHWKPLMGRLGYD